MIAVLAGLLSAAALIAISRALRAERWLYALSLMVLPGLYASFALLAGGPATAGHEMLVGLPYWLGGIALALLGRRHPVAVTAVVAALWLLHGGYDLIHPQLFVNSGVPGWYPLYCASVDVAIGLYLGWLAWQAAGSLALRRRVAGLFGLNAVLNVLWSALYFKLQRPDLALFEVVFLWL